MPPKKSNKNNTSNHQKSNTTNNNKKKQSDDDSDPKNQSLDNRRSVSAKQPPKKSFFDWYLLNIVGHLALFALIGVVDFYSDFVADVCYQVIGITLNIVRIIYPQSFIIAELLNFRIATRLLRPMSLLTVFQSRLAIEGFASPKSLIVGANMLHDISLLCVGVAIFFGLSRINIVRAVYRECWFVFACLRLIVFINDPVAAVSSVFEILATNCLIFMLATGGRPIPAKIVGVLGCCVGCQKLYYLF